MHVYVVRVVVVHFEGHVKKNFDLDLHSLIV